MVHLLCLIQTAWKKRMEERARESRDAKEKIYEDYPWDEIWEDVTKLEKLRVPELGKYIKRGLKQHLKTSKNETAKVIVRHCL